MRIAQVTDRLYCGGAVNDASALESVKKFGITHILNLDSKCHGVKEIETMHYYLDDDGEHKPDRYYDICIRYGVMVLRESENKLFVHCAAGRNRSASICYGILCCRGPHEEAERLVKEYFDTISKKDKNWERPK